MFLSALNKKVTTFYEKTTILVCLSSAIVFAGYFIPEIGVLGS